MPNVLGGVEAFALKLSITNFHKKRRISVFLKLIQKLSRQATIVSLYCFISSSDPCNFSF